MQDKKEGGEENDRCEWEVKYEKEFKKQGEEREKRGGQGKH